MMGGFQEFMKFFQDALKGLKEFQGVIQSLKQMEGAAPQEGERFPTLAAERPAQPFRSNGEGSKTAPAPEPAPAKVTGVMVYAALLGILARADPASTIGETLKALGMSADTKMDDLLAQARANKDLLVALIGSQM
jgi:hypothetical protein